jgi:hypothetical protein
MERSDPRPFLMGCRKYNRRHSPVKPSRSKNDLYIAFNNKGHFKLIDHGAVTAARCG